MLVIAQRHYIAEFYRNFEQRQTNDQSILSDDDDESNKHEKFHSDRNEIN